MSARLAWLASMLMLCAAPAGAAELADAVFQVTYSYAGEDQVSDGMVVPLLPSNACYNWYIRLAEGPAPATATETLWLPVALEDWGPLANDPDDGIEIAADGKSLVRTFVPEPDADGWFSYSWCVVAGDPTGPHSIEIAIDGAILKTFDFEVVQPEDFSWPAIYQPGPHERSVDHSW